MTICSIGDKKSKPIQSFNYFLLENIGKYTEKDVMGRSSCDVRAITYCDLHKIERLDLLDVLEIYPDFAQLFEKKFQVTFDLREVNI